MSESALSGLGRTIETVVADEPEESDGSMGVLSGPVELMVKALPVEVLRKNVKELVDSLHEVFSPHGGKDGGAGRSLRLSEVQVGLSITATGGIRLIGTAEVATQGAITLTFTVGEGE